MEDVQDSISKTEFLAQLHAIQAKAASEVPLTEKECLFLLAGEILGKSTRQEQGYSDE